MNKRENSEVEQEISLRLEMAELSMNFEIYKEQRDRESLRTSMIEPAGRKTRCKMAGKSLEKYGQENKDAGNKGQRQDS